MMMIYIAERWKTPAVLVLFLLLTELAFVGVSSAQIRKDEVDFEILDTVTMKKGDNLWNLAKKYYDDPLRWKYIMDMNRIPNERKIGIGTVIYIPIKDAKRIAKIVEKKIEEKEVVKEDLSGEIAKLREELRSLKEENANLKKALDECLSEKEKLAKRLEEKEAALKEKDATIADLQAMLDNIKAAFDKMKADMDKMKAEADLFAQTIAERDRRIRELESKLADCQSSLERLEKLRIELELKLRQAEMAREMPSKPMKREYTTSERSMVAAIAIAIVGSIMWISSD